MHFSFKITYFSFILCIYLLFYIYTFIFYTFLHFSFFYPKSPLNIYYCFQFSLFMYFLNVRMSGFFLLCLQLGSVFSSNFFLKSSVFVFVSSCFILFFILILSKRKLFIFLFFLFFSFLKTIFFLILHTYSSSSLPTPLIMPPTHHTPSTPQRG